MNDRSAPAVPYLVFSWEHNAFWRPGRCGYTRLIEEAGRYPKDVAEKICRDALPSVYRSSAGEPPEICFPAPEAFGQADAGQWPQELAFDSDLADILGRPNFTFGLLANAYRAAGTHIPRKAESEQAFFIHRFTGMLLKNPDGWRDDVEADIDATIAEAKERAGTKADG